MRDRSLFKLTGWGPLPLPGERRRLDRAAARGDALLELARAIDSRAPSAARKATTVESIANPLSQREKALLEQLEQEFSAVGVVGADDPTSGAVSRAVDVADDLLRSLDYASADPDNSYKDLREDIIRVVNSGLPTGVIEHESSESETDKNASSEKEAGGAEFTNENNERPRPTRLGLWGPPSSGKSTFVHTLPIAVEQSQTGSWTLTALDAESTDYLIAAQTAMLGSRVLPKATTERTVVNWRIEGTFQSKGARKSQTQKRVRRIDVELNDEPAKPQEFGDAVDRLAGSDGLIYLFDPLQAFGPSEKGDLNFLNMIHALRYRLRASLTGDGKLPHHLAVCVNKLDSPQLLSLALKGGWVSYDSTGADRPYIVDELAESFFDWLYDQELSKSGVVDIRQTIESNFDSSRVRYYVCSAVGFMVTDGRFSFADTTNLEVQEGGVRMRQAPRPLNVIEPILDLDEAIRRSAEAPRG